MEKEKVFTYFYEEYNPSFTEDGIEFEDLFLWREDEDGNPIWPEVGEVITLSLQPNEFYKVTKELEGPHYYVTRELNDILGELKMNPIFKMSLGSKELFHSNFLEYLWELDNSRFINMINSLLPKEKAIVLESGKEYFMGREKEKIDICIFHKEDKKEVYDLVIENKVKSIPYKKQLEEYFSKVQEKGSNNCKFILLTLSDEFPDKDNDRVKKWKITNYKTLKDSIRSQYLGNAQISEKDQTYIRDYCDFIEQLDNLKEILIPNDQQFLFVKEDKDLLDGIRLHDLYIKLRCSWFAVFLKKRLEEEGIATKIIYKYEEREFGVVNINVTINQGNGQIAAWICCDRDKEKDGKTNMFEIVIQGNQYRHGINQECVDKENQGPERLNELYDRLNNHLEDQRPIKFLNFEGEFSIGANLTTQPDPDKQKNHRRNKSQDPVVQKSGPFDCYGEDYIYRYKKIDNIPISQLLEWMVRDVKIILDSMPDLNTLKN